MSRNLLLEFTVNKEAKKIHVKREFDADVSLVWQAWTTAELLDKWWAPLPYRNKTKSMDFKVGGTWHYAMMSPDNVPNWYRFDYEQIEVQGYYAGYDAFCDEDGNISDSFPRMHWRHDFSQSGERTTVNVTMTLDSLETLEKVISMGFKDGFSKGLSQLDDLLDSLK